MAGNVTVIIRGDVVRREYKGNGAITPGQILEFDSSGDVLRHNSAGGNVTPLVALENDLQGDDLNDNYADNVQVQCAWLPTGTEFNGLLKEGQSAAIGDFLESDGAGDLQVHAADTATAQVLPNTIIAVALEAVDLSDSSGADPVTRRIRVAKI